MTSCLNNDVGYGFVVRSKWSSEAKGQTGFSLGKGGTVSGNHLGAFYKRDGPCTSMET